MLLMLILKAFDGSNGVIIYSAKLLFHRDHSKMRYTALVPASSEEECVNSSRETAEAARFRNKMYLH